MVLNTVNVTKEMKIDFATIKIEREMNT